MLKNFKIHVENTRVLHHIRLLLNNSKAVLAPHIVKKKQIAVRVFMSTIFKVAG